MAEKMGARVKKAANQKAAPELKAALRAAGAVRDALINLQQHPLQATTQARAGELAGHLMAHVVDRLRAGDFPMVAGDEAQQEAARNARKQAADLIGVSETIISLSQQGLPPLDLAKSFREGSSAGDQRVALEGVRHIDSLRQKLMLPEGTFFPQR